MSDASHDDATVSIDQCTSNTLAWIDLRGAPCNRPSDEENVPNDNGSPRTTQGGSPASVRPFLLHLDLDAECIYYPCSHDAVPPLHVAVNLHRLSKGVFLGAVVEPPSSEKLVQVLAYRR